jgi:hypothetical protein
MTAKKDTTNNNSLVSGFDLDALRLPQNFGESLGVKKLITRIPIRKPNKTEFFRVRIGEEGRYQTTILEIKEESETFLLAQSVWNVIPELVRPAVLHVAIDRQNNLFLIPVLLPGPDGRRNPWHQSLAEVVAAAEKHWVRSVANKAVGAYDLLIAQANLTEPDWPELSLCEIIETAFRDRLIQSADHPVILQLLGRS